MPSKHRRSRCVVLTVSFIIGAICFGVALYYQGKSKLNIEHICNVSLINSHLCEYQCGQSCSSSFYSSEDDSSDDNVVISDDSNEFSQSIFTTHCTPRYCWGYEYEYQWQTLDWKYPPFIETYKMNAISSKRENNGYGKKDIFLEAQMQWYLHQLLNYLNGNRTKNVEHCANVSFSAIAEFLKTKLDIIQYLNSIQQTLSTKYLLNRNASRMSSNVNISDIICIIEMQVKSQLQSNNHSSENMNIIELDKVSSNCDSIQSIFTTYGACSAIPWKEYSLGYQRRCYTNYYCSSWTWNSPEWNSLFFHIWEYIGYASLVVFTVTVIASFVMSMVRKCRGESYSEIPSVQQKRIFQRNYNSVDSYSSTSDYYSVSQRTRGSSERRNDGEIYDQQFEDEQIEGFQLSHSLLAVNTNNVTFM